MIIEYVPPARRREGQPLKRKREQPTPPKPEHVTLIAATYSPEDPTPFVVLVFDRPVAFDLVPQDSVQLSDDDDTGGLFRAGSATPIDEVTIRIELENIGVASGPGVVLNVSTDNGIYAAGTSDQWVGVTGLALPFP